MNTVLPESWSEVLAEELSSDYFKELSQFVKQERQGHIVYPSENDLFSAFGLCSYKNTRVVILGQDPYHGAGQAHGLAFSVKPGAPIPPSLSNIFTELEADLGIRRPSCGLLAGWARQGVLLLNTVLTVREGEPNSHKGKGWEIFTDAVIKAVAQKEKPVVFVLWGNPARAKSKIIAGRHIKIESPHPSPFSAHRGFFGSCSFSRVNQALTATGQAPIDWADVG
jgi:uracil-DNA glycosylase